MLRLVTVPCTVRFDELYQISEFFAHSRITRSESSVLKYSVSVDRTAEFSWQMKPTNAAIHWTITCSATDVTSSDCRHNSQTNIFSMILWPKIYRTRSPRTESSGTASPSPQLPLSPTPRTFPRPSPTPKPCLNPTPPLPLSRPPQPWWMGGATTTRVDTTVTAPSLVPKSPA